ncbi:MAG: APC family permease [Betaproteobacteria bacterium]|nr:APC family permease [Betaproteobacteria bacterium]
MSQNQVELKRALSLPLLTFYGLGTIIGAGIYVLVGAVALEAGALAPWSFLVAAVVAVPTALSFAELAARYPRSGGEVIYVDEGLRIRPLSVVLGVLVVLAAVVSSATLVNGFVGYLRTLANVPPWLGVACLVAALGALAAWGISESAVGAAVATVVEIGGLLLVMAVAWSAPAEWLPRVPELLPPAHGAGWTAVLSGAFLAFYAFLGFEDMVNVAEEVKDPTRNVPRAILLALAVAAVLYLSVSATAVLVLPVADLAGSAAPLALMFERTAGRAPVLISIIGMFAVTNGALVQIIKAARVLYGMSREGWVHPRLGHVHPRRRTPLFATALVTALILIFSLLLPLVTLARLTSFIVLVVFALVQVALLRLKWRGVASRGGFAVPAWVPAVGVVLTVAMLAFELTVLAGGAYQ